MFEIPSSGYLHDFNFYSVFLDTFLLLEVERNQNCSLSLPICWIILQLHCSLSFSGYYFISDFTW